MENNSSINNAGKEAYWEIIKKNSKLFETQMDSLERKRTGSYYTGLELTDAMMRELISKLREDNKEIWKLKFFEPCVGVGNFVFSYLKEISLLGYNNQQMTELINNIFVADINKDALENYKQMLSQFVKIYFNIELPEEYFDVHIGSTLLIDVIRDEPKYIKLTDVFSTEIVEAGFDIVVTNPPYKNLKAEKSQYANAKDYETDKTKYAEISKLIKKTFILSADGVLNLYKLFVEEIVCEYANQNAFVSLLIPASILSDKTCEKLRTYILKEVNLISVRVIGEGSGFVDAQQALTALLIQKGKGTAEIQVTKDYKNAPDQVTVIQVKDVLNENTGNAIFSLNNQEYEMLKQIRCFPVVKDLDYIVNLRGELDLTANKASIVSNDTGYPLLRGRNIGYYSVLDTGEREYVSEEFVDNSKKISYIKDHRIICQQVVNMHKERRVTFAYVEPNYILGNSCNFITVKDNEFGVDIYSVLGLFNTSIINWLFKLTSSNNHVNNYEIDCFPIPIGSKYMEMIGNLVKKYLDSREEKLLDEIEELAYLAYEIRKDNTNNQIEDIKNNDYVKGYYESINYILPNMSFEMASQILNGNASIEAFVLQNGVDFDKATRKVIEGITDKYQKIYKGEILNHTTFKLSDLDMEMIRAVPQGGSWKNIPMKTVEKSKRLKRITETGGRTTLYGRIDYDKPSYTITTYFNRPGNGTYVHPIHDRVLSVREAARFQCFTDDYYFYGNKTQILKQVGNAVPTILAYQIAKNIIDKTDCKKSIDLFCGAGGMTAGFKSAGIQSILSNDIEESACITLKINNPEIDVFCGDITEQDTKDRIVNEALNQGADIICGGPPCQGFSMAGFRLTDDPRNQLFKEFIDVVIRVRPKIIVFENVEGIISFQGGEVYKAILELFSEVGYNAEGRTLMTNHYGVPQKRKRVIIICTRNDLTVKPEDLFPVTITEDANKQITARETIEDLENVECKDNAKYLLTSDSDIVKLFKREIAYSEFVNRHSFSHVEKDEKEDEKEDGQLTFLFS